MQRSLQVQLQQPLSRFAQAASMRSCCCSQVMHEDGHSTPCTRLGKHCHTLLKLLAWNYDTHQQHYCLSLGPAWPHHPCCLLGGRAWPLQTSPPLQYVAAGLCQHMSLVAHERRPSAHGGNSCHLQQASVVESYTRHVLLNAHTQTHHQNLATL